MDIVALVLALGALGVALNALKVFKNFRQQKTYSKAEIQALLTENRHQYMTLIEPENSKWNEALSQLEVREYERMLAHEEQYHG